MESLKWVFTSSISMMRSCSGGTSDSMDKFPYLGSIVDASGRMDVEVEKKIAPASRACETVRKHMFLDRNIRLNTKRKI